MSQWYTVFKKEIIQQWHNKQLIWFPIVFILLAIMDPITFYFLPELLELTGGLPEGAIFEIPELQPEEALLMALEQLNTFGVLLLVLISMGTIARERSSLIGEMMFTKPIRPFQYVFAKWGAFVILTVLALTVGLLMNWYYVNILFGKLSFKTFSLLLMFYSLWFLFVLAIILFYNSFAKKQWYVALFTIVTLLGLTLINTLFNHYLPYFPNQLTSELQLLVTTGNISVELWGIAIILLIVSCCLLSSAAIIFKRIKI